MPKYRVIQGHCDGACTIATCDTKAEAVAAAEASHKKAEGSPWGPVRHSIYFASRVIKTYFTEGGK